MATVIGNDLTQYKRMTCHNCASIIQYTRSELIWNDINHDYLGDFDRVQGLYCPNCSKFIQPK
jgi:RNase P subunit RPR2